MICDLSPERVSRLLVARVACEPPKSVAPACFDSTTTAWFHGLVCSIGASHVIGSLRTAHVKFVVREELVASVVAGAVIMIHPGWGVVVEWDGWRRYRSVVHARSS